MFLNGKEIWKSLKTSHFSIAEGKLGEIKKERRKRRNTEIKPGDAKMTLLQAVTLRIKFIEEGVKIKSRTLAYWKEIKAALLKSWTNVDSKEVRRITAADCREWARAYAKVASPNRFNNTVSFLRHAFEIAVEGGMIYANPSRGVERLPVRAFKDFQISLPFRNSRALIAARFMANQILQPRLFPRFHGGLCFHTDAVENDREKQVE